MERSIQPALQQFADMLCGSGLVRRQRKILPIPLRHAVNDNNLERIADANGDVTKRITEKQTMGKHCRKNAGSARQKKCWMCRKYKLKYTDTSWQCRTCKTPLCFPSKEFGAAERDGWKSCVHEHCCSGNMLIVCGGVGGKKGDFPKALKAY